MALDYQKSTYTNFTQRPEIKQKRTSYGSMNQWQQFPTIFEYLSKMEDQPHEVDQSEVRMQILLEMEKRKHIADGVERMNRMGAEAAMSRRQNTRASKIAQKQSFPLWNRVANSRQQTPNQQHPHQKRKTPVSSLYHNIVPDIKTPGVLSYNSAAIPEIKGPTLPLLPHDPNHPVHLEYYKSGGYDDAHKASLKCAQQGMVADATGPRLLRAGRMGASWRHLKEVMQPGGKRIVFVDGIVCQDDLSRMKTLMSPEPSPYDRRPPTGSQVRKTVQKPSKYSSLTIYHDPAVQKGTEKNNWFIMR